MNDYLMSKLQKLIDKGKVKKEDVKIKEYKDKIKE